MRTDITYVQLTIYTENKLVFMSIAMKHQVEQSGKTTLRAVRGCFMAEREA